MVLQTKICKSQQKDADLLLTQLRCARMIRSSGAGLDATVGPRSGVFHSHCGRATTMVKTLLEEILTP